MKTRQITPDNKEKLKVIRERSAKIYLLVTCFFAIVVILFSVLTILLKDREYSESENRMLAQKPELTLESLVNGDFMKDTEDYITDQFFLRDQWINLKVFEDMVLGKRESNGVYIGKDNYLMQIPDNNPDMDAVDRNLEAIRQFSLRNQDLNTVMTLVPNAAYILDDLKPTNAPVRDQSQDIAHAQDVVGDALTYVDLTETMSSHSNEPIYYKTDHHWTSLGAKYAFDTLYSALGISSPAQNYTVYPVTHTFSGTLASKSGYDRAKDTKEIYVPQDVNINCLVNYVDEHKKTASIYESSALEQKDKYEVFFGGNHSRIDINTTLEESKNLLIFKDSYANCFVQFLVPYFRSITIIDPRYYYDEIDKLIVENNITDVLFLYNVDTFMGDKSLADVLEPSE